jgi:hypothetical protein
MSSSPILRKEPTMTQLQKKIVLFLLDQYAKELKDKSWYDDEAMIPGLAKHERQELKRMISSFFVFRETQENGEISLCDLLDLAEEWLKGE